MKTTKRAITIRGGARVGLLLLSCATSAIFILSACSALFGDFDNPADPEAGNYQGYETVASPDLMAGVNPADGGVLFSTKLLVTKVRSAQAYALRIAISSADLESDATCLYAKDDFSANAMSISAANLVIGSQYFWKARAKGPDGAWGAWTAPWSFTCQSIFLVDVPGGTFQRNADPANTSAVSAFSMSTYEITRGQFVSVTGCADPSDINGSHGMISPVTCVTLYHAMVFCNELSIAEGLTPVYRISNSTDPSAWFANSGWGENTVPTSSVAAWDAATADLSSNGYRLPTEMEWLWAAMGADSGNPGAVNATGYAKAFAGSTGANALMDYAWCAGNFMGAAHNVGLKLPNELGLFDMSGNVDEWCWDDWEPWPVGHVSDYVAPAAADGKIIRGGSYQDSATNQALTFRAPSVSTVRTSYLYGFRVVRRP
jgi:formylglycine-generating enzyme required for sulfatase activity